MKNRFYAYQIAEESNPNIYIRITEKLGLKKSNLNSCSFWTSKKKALSWRNSIISKYPIAKLVELKLIKNED